MIIDKLENADKYYCLGENYKTGLQFLKNMDLSSSKQGKIEIQSDDVWANLQIATPRNEDEALFEVHRKYVDIQYVISGSEKMLWTNLGNFITNSEFDYNSDIQFGTIAENSAVASLVVKGGYFVIFTPDDVHKPLLKYDNNEDVKKIVVKVKI